jgi:hypothetical protein
MFALCGRSSAERFPSAEPRLVREKTLDQFDLKAFHVLSHLFQAFNLMRRFRIFKARLA